MTKAEQEWNRKQQEQQRKQKVNRSEFLWLVEGEYEEAEWLALDHK